MTIIESKPSSVTDDAGGGSETQGAGGRSRPVPRVRIQAEDFDLGAEVAELRAEDPRIGAVASFTGVVRDMNDARSVSTLVLEHYPGMTERSIEAIVDQAEGRWSLNGVRVIHRVGSLQPMDQIVMICVASAHRGEAFAACEFIMDYLKTQAPFWKKEGGEEGDRWVETRDSDTKAAERWKTIPVKDA